jgi:hypothetical protein
MEGLMADTIKLPIRTELRLFHGLNRFPFADVLCGLFICGFSSHPEFRVSSLRRMLIELSRSVPDVITDERISRLQEEIDQLEFIGMLRRKGRPPKVCYHITPRILTRYHLMHDRGLLPQHEAAFRAMIVRLWDEHHV